MMSIRIKHIKGSVFTIKKSIQLLNLGLQEIRGVNNWFIYIEKNYLGCMGRGGFEWVGWSFKWCGYIL